MERKLTKEELDALVYAFPVKTELGMDLLCILSSGKAVGIPMEGCKCPLGMPVDKDKIILYEVNETNWYATIEAV